MRAVFDTVVLVRSLLDPYGRSGTLLFDMADAYEWVVSPEIVAEYFEVLRRPRLVNKYRSVETRDLPAMLTRIAAATVVQPTHVPAVCRDPGDDKFLAAAAASGATCLITEDHDLLVLDAYGATQICATAAFLRRIARRDDESP